MASPVGCFCGLPADATTAFDVVGELTFGEKLGLLEKGSDVDSVMAGNDSL